MWSLLKAAPSSWELLQLLQVLAEGPRRVSARFLWASEDQADLPAVHSLSGPSTKPKLTEPSAERDA